MKMHRHTAALMCIEMDFADDLSLGFAVEGWVASPRASGQWVVSSFAPACAPVVHDCVSQSYAASPYSGLDDRQTSAPGRRRKQGVQFGQLVPLKCHLTCGAVLGLALGETRLRDCDDILPGE